jgi:hypothetical protein
MTNDNADGVVPAGVVPPDIGPEASSGFQSHARTASRPYTRDNRRSAAVEGGGFQTAVKQNQDKHLSFTNCAATRLGASTNRLLRPKH